MLHVSFTVVNSALFVSNYKVYLTGIYIYFHSIVLAINKHDIKLVYVTLNNTIMCKIHGSKPKQSWLEAKLILMS